MAKIGFFELEVDGCGDPVGTKWEDIENATGVDTASDIYYLGHVGPSFILTGAEQEQVMSAFRDGGKLLLEQFEPGSDMLRPRRAKIWDGKQIVVDNLTAHSSISSPANG